jgi:hypothetical protein
MILEFTKPEDKEEIEQEEQVEEEAVFNPIFEAMLEENGEEMKSIPIDKIKAFVADRKKFTHNIP